jgi:hypothetical protein
MKIRVNSIQKIKRGGKHEWNGRNKIEGSKSKEEDKNKETNNVVNL